MMLKVYVYHGCSTCRNAIKWLKLHAIPFEEIAIRETPPSLQELQSAAKGRELRALFNVSGQDYRALGLKDRLPEMSSSDALMLLRQNGNLVKRPFVVNAEADVYLVGFKEEEWGRVLL
ncbi:MAG: Spx/MgsR family RNA polymerase-binding regulatory protein [Verrucomicrobiota bacterium]